MTITTVRADQVIDLPAVMGAGVPVELQGVVVVAVEGDVDLYSGPDLRQALAEVLSAPVDGQAVEQPGAGGDASPGADGPPDPVRAVVVDLSEVEFIDSYAVGVLVQGHHLAHRSGRAYALVATHPMIHKLFEITGLVRVLPLHATVATAVHELHPVEEDARR